MERQLIKKILSIAVILVLLFTSVTSCNRAFDEEEVISAAKELLPAAEKLNYIYYGEGIKYYDSDAAVSIYKEAQKSHLDELGFHTVDELKAMTEEVFSDSYSQTMYSSVLDTLRVDDTIVGYKRYYDYTNDDGESMIMVNVMYEPLIKSTISYDYESIKVKGAKKEKVFLSVSAVVSNADGESRMIDITITLVEEEDGWKIDNPIFANY